MPKICILDAFCKEDEPALIELFTSHIGREYLGGAVAPEMSRERAKQWISLSQSEPIWAMRSTKNQEFLGYVSLSEHHDGEDTEVSYELLPRHWGNGYAAQALTEALLRASTDYGLAEVVAETQSKNHRSIKLLKRVGMIEERRLIRFDAEQVIYRWALNSNQQLRSD
jgi:ribosomal-protein-alanine N-acetyltransferase